MSSSNPKGVRPPEGGQTPASHRCGSVVILGRPNVGKSTLLNRLLGEKIAIVSHKPETTREQLLGILTLADAQILFYDTPGIYRAPSTLLGKHQVQAARDALEAADVMLLMTEAQAGLTDEDKQIVGLLKTRTTVPGTASVPGTETEGLPVLLAINKADRVKKSLILPQIEEANHLYPFREIVPISARDGDNTEPLLKALVQALPVGPALYPADELTDKPARTLVQELIREKTLLFTHEEVPYAVAVLVEEWREGEKPKGVRPLKKKGSDPVYIRATIYVERDSQKGILIGKGGGLLKKIGEAARKEIEALLKGPIFLDLWIKVAKNWRKDPQMLRRLGYGA